MAEQVPTRESTSLTEKVSEATNILVMTPSFADGTSEICTGLLAGDDSTSATVSGITYTKSPDAWIDEWQRHADTPPARGLVIGVGNRGHIAVADDSGPADSVWQTESIEQPGDLTQLGITLSEFLDTVSGADATVSPRLCFDSLTALLQYADLKRAFRFLHVVTGRVQSANAVGHYHLDPDAHDEQTLATITGLFDAIVETDERGEWTVKTR